MNVQCMVAYLLKWHHACAKILGQRVFGVQELFVYSGCFMFRSQTAYQAQPHCRRWGGPRGRPGRDLSRAAEGSSSVQKQI